MAAYFGLQGNNSPGTYEDWTASSDTSVFLELTKMKILLNILMEICLQRGRICVVCGARLGYCFNQRYASLLVDNLQIYQPPV